MKAYEFAGPPIAWKRAGLFKGRFYDKQIKDKDRLRDLIKTADKALCCSNKPLSVFYEFNMPIPPSWSKIRRLNAIGSFHVNTPDLDNMIKFINDTFNGILWKDDRQIAETYATKRYAEEVSTKIIIVELEDE